MKCTDLLIQDHKIILRCLDVLQQMALCVEKGQPPVEQDVVTLLGFLRAFADEHHQMKEESALFPELLRASSKQDGPLHQMLFEHDQERSLVEGLEESLFTKHGIEFVQFANRLTSLIRNHIYKEDNILFDIVDRSISDEQDEKVVAEFSNFQINPSVLADLRRQEWKYLRKAAA
jgi:hemerythrin-like domain-containing protein